MKRPEQERVEEGHGEGPEARARLPVAPSMGPTLAEQRWPRSVEPVDGRVVFISGMAVLLALAAGLVAQGLGALIHLFTNIAFFGRLSTENLSPADHALGPWVIGVPVVGAVIVGFMARYGSRAIRGHGIPEAMEQVLYNQSRIPPRMTFLKPLSAAVAIGTGGPFGAEGPIIATGGALGSLLGQLLRVTADERKALLAAGAAAGMAATFGAPVSAVLLAVELLLFEYRPRSVIPVALATATATGVRMAFVGGAPAFAMPDLVAPSGSALAFYIVMGAVVGLASMGATKAVYAIEDAFEKLPLHWMWWPALGAVVVGAVGYFSPRTLGVGYTNIEDILSGRFVGAAMLLFCVMKFVSWSIALGSGTSGGTLAPLFTLGGGLGSGLGLLATRVAPQLGVDVRIAALVGMAAIFAGASRALLASVVFAFETTRQPMGLLPLLGGCSAAYLVSSLLMRHSIMTEKLARRGGRVLTEYGVDPLSQALVKDHAARQVVTLASERTLEDVRAWLGSGAEGTRHQGFPVVAPDGALLGVVTRRDLLDGAATDGRRVGELLKRPLAVAFEDSSLREAADLMVEEGVGRLPVVCRDAPTRVVGIVTRSDLLSAHRQRLENARRVEQGLRPTRQLAPRASHAG
ncbi:chloride channel protein [Corallococcus sp. H22C18031201]|uniref:chloride channel protein n=1 Tax=Citreicoccus inhibens TaxID=2849499 RepID=UPI000E72404E|nr:chloride channel protein [Citreicoccus inhibens]MBU8900246.1 chloride channel protein [Citreicoccus inhibens]RJS18349.1 chloride channel protein [Corallococcus sp. H22C18031201]